MSRAFVAIFHQLLIHSYRGKVHENQRDMHPHITLHMRGKGQNGRVYEIAKVHIPVYEGILDREGLVSVLLLIHLCKS